MFDHEQNEYPARVANGFFEAFAGKLIGSGGNRRVYECRFNPELVVKLERNLSAKSWCNIQEATMWDAAGIADMGFRGDPFSKWLAPVKFISECGTVLVMERTYPLAKEKYPAKLPVWLSDFCYRNYGRLKNGRFVCHDYGNMDIMFHGLYSKRTKKPHWYGDD